MFPILYLKRVTKKQDHSLIMSEQLVYSDVLVEQANMYGTNGIMGEFIATKKNC